MKKEVAEKESLIQIIEALLLVSAEPVPIETFEFITSVPKGEILACLDVLKEKYSQNHGFELVNISNKYQFRTLAKYVEYVQKLKSGKPRRLSPAALETLSVVAYRQPVVKADIEKIRGVDVTPTLKTLLEKKLIKIIGYQSTVGQPALYSTTEEFLSVFGLESLEDMPNLREIENITQDPGEIDVGESEVGNTEIQEAELNGL